MKYKTKKIVDFAVLLAGCLFVQAVIWVPEIAHFHVARPEMTDTQVDQAISGGDKNVAAAIQRIDFGLAGDLSDIETVLAAENMLVGRLYVPGVGYRDVGWPFEKGHLLLGGPTFQLRMAGLAWLELVVDAWRLTGEDKFLDFAEENALRFIRFEARQILPTGYLWNDHAVANRTIVYAHLWAALNTKNGIKRETARSLLVAADRSARLLARPSHYTYRTNHGVMQNVGLIVVAAAFPSLTDSEVFMSVGYERLARQMNYFLSNQGAVLEHSVGYHEFGVGILRSCFALLRALSVPVKPEHQSRLEHSEEILRLFSRPDYSIPNFGDSHQSLGKVGRAIVDSANRESVDLIGHNDQDPKNGSFVLDAGYAIFRSGIGTSPDSGVHAAANWSHFISNAHEHADELSINYWVDGTSLWSGSGYWPYGDPHRGWAVGWAGSNAPHFVGERAVSDRASVLHAIASGPEYAIWLLRRKNKDGYNVSRQVVLFRDSWGLVLDSVQDQQSRQTEVIWGVPTHINMTSREKRSARIVDRDSDRTFGLSIDATAPVAVTYFRGSLSPFLGWTASEGTVKEAWTVRVLSHANSTVATAWGKLSGTAANSELDVQITDWQGESDWSVNVQVEGTLHSIRRAGSKVIISGVGLTDLEVLLNEPGGDQSLSDETEAYRAEVSSAEDYPEYFHWRKRLSIYFLYFFLGLGLVIALMPGRYVASLFPFTVTGISFGSIALGAYIQFVYFVP